MIALTATVAVSCTKNSGDSNGGGGGGTKTSAAQSDVASANDNGPVGIITEDPSCAPWTPITNTLAGVESNGWLKRDPSIPLGAWTPEARGQYEAVGKAMRKAADQAVPLSKMTTHRVMREMYGQFIAYSRAYADSLMTYTAVDDNLASAASTASLVITYVCGAVISGAAEARASLVPAPAPPPTVAPVGNLSNPQRIFDTPDTVCSELSPTLQQLLQNPVFKSWVNGDPSVPAANLPPDQQALADAVAPLMTSTADALETLAKKTSNPVVRDFIELGVQYRRTFVQALATYQANDQDVYLAGQYAPGVVSMACRYAAS
nr:hypothetical protein [Mycolicibacterium llatzerense]